MPELTGEAYLEASISLAEPQPVPIAEPRHSLRFHGQGGTLFGIFVVNILLTLVTFGIYAPWAKARRRRYMYAQTDFAGDRFAYHATGHELFVGALKALVLFLPIAAIVVAITAYVDGELGQALANWFIYLSFACVTPVVVVGALRFRMARTSWRGVRFSFRGKVSGYMKVYWPGLLLTALTLGIYYPWFRVRNRRFLTEHCFFGGERFDFDGTGDEMFKQSLQAFLLSIITLGLYWFWFLAWRHRFFWNHTTFAGARFECRVEGFKLLWVYTVCAIMIVGTLGIATPWAMVMSRRYLLDNLTLIGNVNFDQIQQRAQAASATAEGMSEVLDLGLLDLDLGL